VYILNQGLLTLQQSDPRAPGSLHAEDEASALGARPEKARQIIRQRSRVDRLGKVAVALGQLLQRATGSLDGVEQRKVVLAAAQELAQLHRGNHEGERVRIERERWESRQAEAREKKRAAQDSAARAERIRAQFFPDLDEDWLPRSSGAMPAELHACLAANTRLRKGAEMAGHERTSEIPASNQAGSSPIKPNQAS